MLTPIYFGGFVGPCEAQYGIHIEEDTLHIVVFQSKPGTSLWNSKEGRNQVLNAVLDRHVAGVRLDQIRFYVILDTRTNGLLGIELPIHLDHADYRARGGRVLTKGWFRKPHGIWNFDAVAGSGRCFVEFEERQHMADSDIERFSGILGYYSPHRPSRVTASA